MIENSGTIALTAGSATTSGVVLRNGGWPPPACSEQPVEPKAACRRPASIPRTPSPPRFRSIFQPAQRPSPLGTGRRRPRLCQSRQRPDLRVDHRQHCPDPGPERLELAGPALRHAPASLQKPGNPDAVWEIAVRERHYRCAFSRGTPRTRQVFRRRSRRADRERHASTSTRWLEGTSTATVTDGRLTIRRRPRARAPTRLLRRDHTALSHAWRRGGARDRREPTPATGPPPTLPAQASPVERALAGDAADTLCRKPQQVLVQTVPCGCR